MNTQLNNNEWMKKGLFLFVTLFLLSLAVLADEGLVVKTDSSEDLSALSVKQGLQVLNTTNSTNTTSVDPIEEINLEEYEEPTLVDRSLYLLGDIVTISLGQFDLSTIELYISFEDITYKYLGEPTAEIFFSPQVMSTYFVEVYDGENLLSYAEFVVSDSYDRSTQGIEKGVLFVDKEYVVLLDSVNISINSLKDASYQLIISHDLDEYRYLGAPQETITFVPRELGVYSIELFEDNILLAARNFTAVSSNDELPAVNGSNQLQVLNITSPALGTNQTNATTFNETLSLENQTLGVESLSVQALKQKWSVQARKSQRILNYDLTYSKNNQTVLAMYADERYDAEIVVPNKRIQKVMMRDLDVSSPSLELKIDDIAVNADIPGKQVLNQYAIDPSGLNFTTGTATVNARGHELWKCQDWNFSEERCFGEWVKVQNIQPGENYNITLYPGDPGFAETGLASINSKKSIYEPGEDVDLIVVVLDTEGRLQKKAFVQVNVTSPSGSLSTFATDTGEITETSNGIYEFTFEDSTEVGTYSIVVNARDTGLDNTMISSFEVATSYPFDIIRNTPVVTDPWKEQVISQIAIAPRVPSGLYNFTEVIPKPMSIVDSGTALVTEFDNYYHLTWNDLSGNSLVEYVVQPPLVSPELFALGEGFVSFGNETFFESRPWYLAIDPAIEWKVQSGTVATGASATHTFDLSEDVVLNQSFIYFRQRMTNANDNSDDSAFYADFVDNNTVRFTRISSTGSVNIDFYVISSNALYVQSGTIGFTNTQSTITDTISAVNQSRTMVIADGNCDGTGAGTWDESFWTANMTDSTTVSVRREAATTCDGTVGYFAVEFNEDIIVQQGETNLTATTGSGTLAIPVNTSSSFLMLQKRCPDATTGMDDCATRAEISGSTTVNFVRDDSQDATVVKYYVVDIEGGLAQRNQQDAGTGSTYTEALGTTVNRSRSFATFFSTASGSGTRWSRASWSARIHGTGDSGNQINLTRDDTGNTNDGGWEVYQFPPKGNAPPEILSLDFPADTAVINYTPFDFNFTATDDEDPIQNCSLFANFSSTWELQDTLESVSIDTQYNITQTPDDGTFVWNVHCVDSFNVLGTFASNFTVTVAAPPDITGSVTNDGPVDEGEAITFSGTCNNIGDTFRLVVCNSSAPYCNASTQVDQVLCNGTFSTTTTPSCTIITDATEVGTQNGTATCCDDGGLCDQEAITIEDFIVRGAPVVREEASDQSSNETFPTQAGTDVEFTITAESDSGDDYYLLVCPTNATNPGQGDCEFGQNRWCWSQGQEVATGLEATCNYTTVANTDSGNQEWYAFACNNNSAPNILCSPGFNGTAYNGSPFYVNNEPDLLGIQANLTYALSNSDITINSSDATDQESDELQLLCGNESGNYNLCASSYSVGNRSCNFTSPWTDNEAYTIYCVLNDSFSLSTEFTDVIIADNARPTVINLGTNDSDRIVQPDTSIIVNVTAIDNGSRVVSVEVFNESTETLSQIGSSDNWEVATSANLLGCVETDANCTLHFVVTDNVSLVNNSEFFDITVDGVNPHVLSYSNNDSDGVVSLTQDIRFNVTVNDTNIVVNVTLGNESTLELSQVGGGSSWEINTTAGDLGCTTDDGLCNVSIGVYDVAGNLNASEAFTFILDVVSPRVGILQFNDSTGDVIVQPLLTLRFNVSVNDTQNLSSVYLGNDTFLTMDQMGTQAYWELNATPSALGCPALEGNCTLHINATDLTGNINDSVSFNISVDGVNPGALLPGMNDSDRFVSAQQVVKYNITVNDSSGIFRVSLANISSVNLTSIGGSNVWEVNASAQDLGCLAVDGNCTAVFTVYDHAENINRSETLGIVIDGIFPSVNNLGVNDSDLIVRSDTPLRFNVTINDTSTITNVSLGNQTFLGMNQNATGPFWEIATTASALGCLAVDGTCGIQFNAIDAVGNINDTEAIILTVDDTTPSVTNLDTDDSDNYVNSTLTLNVSVEVTDTNSITSVTVNGTSMTQSGTTWWVLTSAGSLGCTEGNCILGISATDVIGNINDSEFFNVTVDDSPPEVSLNYPVYGYNTTQTSFAVNFSATDALDSVLDCDVALDGQINNTASVSANSGQGTNYSITGLNEGNHTWFVTCADELPQQNNSLSRNFTVDQSPPVITLLDPSNGTVETSTNTITFDYSVVDALLDVENCSFVLDGSVEGDVDVSVFEGITQSFDRVLTNGAHHWRVDCADTLGNIGSSGSFNITVNVQSDTTPPLVTLSDPEDNDYLSNTSINFTFTPSDATGVSSCSLYVNDTLNQTCYAPEFLQGFSSRQRITINETSNDDLEEFQVRLEVNTSDLILQGLVNSDCSNLRFTTGDNTLVPYYIENSSYIGCDQEDTNIWVRIPRMNANDGAVLFMYYNHPTETTSLSDKWGVFNYSSPQPVYYIVHQTLDTTGPLNVISFRDGNTIEVGTNSDPADEQDNLTLLSSSFSQNSNVSALYPIHGAGGGGGEDAIVPISFASTEFVNIIGRGTQVWSVYAPYGDATVEVYDGNDGAGFTLVGASFVVSSGTTSSVTREIAGTGTGTTDQNTVLINSTAPILVFHHDSISGRDAMAFYPEATDLWCGVTRYTAGVLEDGTTCQFLDSLGGNSTQSLDASDESTYTDYASYRGEESVGLHVSCDGPVGTHVYADEDGAESAVCLPEYELDNEYYLPHDGEYLHIVSPQHDTNCTLYTSAGAVRFSGRTNSSFSYPYPSRLNFGADNSVNVFGGDRLECDHAVYAYLEATPGDATGDEQNLWNVKQFRKGASSEPIITFGEEETNQAGNCSVANGELSHIFIGNVDEGYYNWSIHCTDNSTQANIGNSSTQNFTVDLTAPSAFLQVFPPNGTISLNTTPLFTWDATTEINFDRYYIEIDDDFDFSSIEYSSTINDISTVFYGPTISSNTDYFWKVTAVDLANNNYTTGTFNYTVDTRLPSVSLDSPGNGSWDGDGSVSFAYTPVDLHLTNCSLYGNFSGVWARNETNIGEISGVADTFGDFDFPEGEYVWNIECFDNASNSQFNTTNNTFFVDTQSPNVVLANPEINDNLSSSTVQFNFTAFDTIAPTLNCNISVDGVVNSSAISAVPGTPYTEAISGFNDGGHSYGVTCVDFGGHSYISENRSFLVDTEGPTINLEFPSNETEFAVPQEVTFRYNVTDLAEVDNCSLILNNVVNDTNFTINENQSLNFTKFLNEGDYNWSVNCTDQLGQVGTSLQYELEIQVPVFISTREPQNGTIVDRDSYDGSTPDTIILVAELSDHSPGEPVNFYANLTDPVIADQNNILLGSSGSNQSGFASLNFSGTDSVASKLFAGNYEWWAESGVYGVNVTSEVQVFGGLNVSFRFENESPNLAYGLNDTAQIQMFLKSLGPESDTLLNYSYNASVNTTFVEYNGSNSSVTLVDPEFPPKPFKRGLWDKPLEVKTKSESLPLSNGYFSGTRFVEITINQTPLFTTSEKNLADKLRTLAGKSSRMLVMVWQFIANNIQGRFIGFAVAPPSQDIVAPQQVSSSEPTQPDTSSTLLDPSQETIIESSQLEQPTPVSESTQVEETSQDPPLLQRVGQFVRRGRGGGGGLSSIGIVDRFSQAERNRFRDRFKMRNSKGAYFSGRSDLRNIIGNRYAFDLDLEDRKVRRIVFNDLYLEDTTDATLKIDDVANEKISGIPEGTITESYAIDPTELDFSEATVTATATGNVLYKCKDWDFDSQSCFGTWTKLMDLVPGEEYSFTLTPDDPGFVETALTTWVTEVGTAHIGSTTAGINVTLGITFNESQSFVLVDTTGDTDANAPDEHQVTGYLYNGSLLTLERYSDTSTAPVNISYSIISGDTLFVQRGEIVLPTSTLSDTDVLPVQIDMNRSAVFVSSRCDTTANMDQGKIRANFTDNGTVFVQRFDGGNCEATARYEAVQFGHDVSVIAGNTTKATDAKNVTTTLPEPVNMTRAWLYFSNDAQNPGLGDVTLGGDLQDENTVMFTRYRADGSGDGINRIFWYVIEFPDGSTVQRTNGRQTTTSTTIQNIGISPSVQRNRSFPWISNTQDGSGTTNIPRQTFTYYYTGTGDSASNVQMFRIANGQEFDYYSQVIEFNLPPNQPPEVLSLNFPQDTAIVTSTPINFSFNATDPDGNTLLNCSLWNDFNGTWGPNGTRLNVPANQAFNISQAVDDGTYEWNVQCYDDDFAFDFFDSNQTFTLASPPNITGTVDNNGSVREGTNITFSAMCSNPSDTFRLLVCNESASFCNTSTPQELVICEGENSYNETAICSFTPNSTFAGNHTGDIANCCDDGGICDPESTTVDPWSVNGAPVPYNGPSDQNISSDSRVGVGGAINFTVSARDPNGDSIYKMLVCNNSVTPSGPATCTGGADNLFCSDFADDDTQASCSYTAPEGSTGDFEWFVFVCDQVLCSPAYNGTGVGGSPFFINTNSTMVNVTPNRNNASFGDLINITTLSAFDQEGDAMKLQCGNNTQEPYNNLCTGEFGSAERSCTFSYPWNDNEDHGIYCVLNDSFSLSQINITNITGDNLGPSITLDEPENDTFNLNQLLQFNFTPTDINPLSACELYGSWMPGGWGSNQTLNSPTDGVKNSFTPIVLPDGDYTWNVLCNDTFDNRRFAASNNTIHVDTSPPIISLVSPAPDFTEESSPTIQFSFSASDTETNISSCDLIINGSINATNYDVTEGDPNEFIEVTLDDADYAWSINCTDNNSYTGNSSTREITVSVANFAPVVTLESPSDEGFTNDPSVTFEYNVSDDKGIVNCSLYVNGVLNQTNTTLINISGPNNFTPGDFSEGEHNWTVGCSDNLGQTDQPAVRTFSVDQQNPTVNLVSPLNDTVFNESDRVLFKYNVTDNLGASLQNCSLFINDVYTPTSQINVVQNDTQSFLRILDNQFLHWYVTCRDQAGNLDQSLTYNLTVNASLKLWNNTFTFGDQSEGNGSVEANAGAFYFFPTNITNVRNFTYDTSGPNITLIDPDVNFNTTELELNFTFNASDAFNNISHCYLLIDDQIVNISNETLVNPFVFNATLDFGTHSWQINCTDNLGNMGASAKRLLFVRYKDIYLNSTFIRFSDDQPGDGTLVTINITLHNIGDQAIEDNFFVNVSTTNVTGGTEYLDQVVVTGIEANATENISVVWTARIGEHSINVIPDVEGSIVELNESNQNSSRSILVPVWQYFYGNTSSDILLDVSGNFSIAAWFNETNSSGNLFVADTDSVVSFIDLVPLGRNQSNEESLDDFVELDIALGLSVYNDSVNLTYTNVSSVTHLLNITTFGKSLNYTPIINSTNNSNFYTGVLWDASDGPGSYNGTQDIVFITEQNTRAQGAYGVYDYEIRVPYSLKRYVTPNNEDTVIFYAEIT